MTTARSTHMHDDDDDNEDQESLAIDDHDDETLSARTSSSSTSATTSSSSSSTGSAKRVRFSRPPPSPPRTQLTSVQTLRRLVEEHADPELTELLRQHTFVGIATDEFALVQHATRLYMVHLPQLSEFFFYQQVLALFAAPPPAIRVSPPLPVRQLVRLALDAPEEGGGAGRIDVAQRDHVAQRAAQLLIDKSAMLNEYFSIDVTADGMLAALPELLGGYTPPMVVLPLFLWRLASECNWETEQECFESVAMQLAAFYKFQPGFYLETSEQEEENDGETSTDVDPARDPDPDLLVSATLRHVIEHVFFPALRGGGNSAFVFPSARAGRSTSTTAVITQVACLEQLYKVFERC